MKMRTKAYLVVVLVLVLAGAGTFGILIKTGKLGSKANTTSISLTLSGRITDNKNVPLANTAITFSNSAFQTLAKTTSDQSGRFLITTFAQRPTISSSIIYWFSKDNYYSQTSFKSIILSNSSPSTITKNENVVLTASQSNEICGTAEKIERSGVVFCVFPSISQNLSAYPTIDQQITITADEIIRLRGITGLVDTPKAVFLTNEGVSGPGGHADLKNNIMDIWLASLSDQKSIDNYLSIIDHEFGHFVDFSRGKSFTVANLDPTLNIPGQICFPLSSSELKCPSSLDYAFTAAFENLVTTSTVLGYASEVEIEFFADFFSALVSNRNALPEKTKYYLTNYMLNVPSSFLINSGNKSFISKQNNISHNNLMYAYKFVASKVPVDQFFPGTLYDDFSLNPNEAENNTKINNYRAAINSAKYMSVGVVSIRLKDHTGRPMEKQTVELAGEKILTRLKKDSGVFSDGFGDLFDTTGTAVSLGSGVGTNKLVDIPTMVSYYQGAGWLGQKTDIIQGSNAVINLGFTLRKIYPVSVATIPMGPFGPPTGATLKITSNITGKQFGPVTKGKMTRYPLVGTVNGFGDSSSKFEMVLGGNPLRKEEYAMSNWGKYTLLNVPNFASDRGILFLKGRCGTADYTKTGYQYVPCTP